MTFTVPPTRSLALSGIVPSSSFGGGGGRWKLVAGVVGATLDVAPKGFGFAGVGAPKGLVGCMWGYSGRLGRMVIGWNTPKSSEVVAEAATEFVVAGLAASCCEYS